VLADLNYFPQRKLRVSFKQDESTKHKNIFLSSNKQFQTFRKLGLIVFSIRQAWWFVWQSCRKRLHAFSSAV